MHLIYINYVHYNIYTYFYIYKFFQCLFRKLCFSKVRQRVEDVRHWASCALKPNTSPSEKSFAYFCAMEHLKPVGHSESGHECTVWSLSCLKQ